MTEPAQADQGAHEIPPFAALRAFEAVFRTGGIRKAAADLKLDHAVVSRHIRGLEAWLGAPLIIRAGNRLGLTEEGARFHASVSAALADLAMATRAVRGRVRTDQLRLTCIPGLSIQWLSARLAEFERLHPAYRIELKPTEAAANFSAYETDLDIRYYRDGAAPPGGRGLKVAELARPRVIPVASPAFVAQAPAVASPADLPALPLLHEQDREEWRAWLALAGVAVPDPVPGILCWHAHLAISAAKEGRGVALANHFLVSDDLRNGRLVAVGPQPADPIILGSYAMVAREDRWSMPALQAVRRFLRDAASSMDGA